VTDLPKADVLAALAVGHGWTVRTRQADGTTTFKDTEALATVNVRGVRGRQRFTVLWEQYHPTWGKTADKMPVPIDVQGTLKTDEDGNLLTDWREVFVYWWTTEHTVIVPGMRIDRSWTKGKYPGQHVQSTKVVHDPNLDETVTYTTPRPMPRRVGISDLKGYLK
jgi:hypothetical protein